MQWAYGTRTVYYMMSSIVAARHEPIINTGGSSSILCTPLYHIGSQGIPITMTITNHTLLLPDAMIVTVEYLTIKVSLLGHTVTYKVEE